ncbi:hypothetical protein GJ744_010228 [Endocarpon pusillum]|uniref:SET domain-containing protein n=1 Tax=Endocarpon pusillum TaxID=364733 RepID=A0A8H7AEK8_9EURO|nr:hypothetical protein GJ744_010228 [Endocarpon pusillum]
MPKSISPSPRGWFRKRLDDKVDKAKSLPNRTGLDTATSTSQSLPKQENDGAVQDTHLKIPDLTSQDEFGQGKCGLFLLSDEVRQQTPKYNVMLWPFTVWAVMHIRPGHMIMEKYGYAISYQQTYQRHESSHMVTIRLCSSHVRLAD